MANLPRTAKSGSDWTQADLDTYNIVIVAEDAVTFFGVPKLPQPLVDQELLDKRDAADMASDRNAELINLLDLAMIPSTEDSAVIDFAVALFKALGYVKRDRVARTRKDLTLLICGERRHARTDVCILDRARDDILLVVQEEKCSGESEALTTDAQAQLIAEAIAAFSYNNASRLQEGLPAYDSKLIPGIVMLGTSPAFYKINVTSELEYCVRHGLYPANATRVSMHQPVIPRPNHRWSEGMKSLDARQEVMKCYEAFKAIVGI